MYPKIKYDHVPDDASETSDEQTPPTPRFLRAPAKRPTRTCTLILVLICSLVASNALTWFCTAKLWKSKGVQKTTVGMLHVDDDFEAPIPRSKFAGLAYDTEDLLESHSPYTDHNDTARDQIWLDMDLDAGMIALDKTESENWGIPLGQTFPWDNSKSIYLLQAHHSLHCARSIYISLMEYRKGLRQSRRHAHIIHCLDTLRSDTLCYADDTPRRTSGDIKHEGETGYEQYRKCRNFDELDNWAKQHTACFRYDHEAEGNAYPEIQRFVWCPEGSPYRKEVDKYFVVDYDTPRGSGII